jgi:toluene monooxygenase system ferredoxin subunit
MAFQRVTSLTDFWSGEKIGLTLSGKRVLLVNVDGAIYAYEDACPHLGLALSEGELQGARLTCRGHLWEYDASTGRGINPATMHLVPLPVRVERDDVFVDPGV